MPSLSLAEKAQALFWIKKILIIPPFPSKLHPQKI